jgi:hypothetical protein
LGRGPERARNQGCGYGSWLSVSRSELKSTLPETELMGSILTLRLPGPGRRCSAGELRWRRVGANEFFEITQKSPHAVAHGTLHVNAQTLRFFWPHRGGVGVNSETLVVGPTFVGASEASAYFDALEVECVRSFAATVIRGELLFVTFAAVGLVVSSLWSFCFYYRSWPTWCQYSSRSRIQLIIQPRGSYTCKGLRSVQRPQEKNEG